MQEFISMVKTAMILRWSYFQTHAEECACFGKFTHKLGMATHNVIFALQTPEKDRVLSFQGNFLLVSSRNHSERRVRKVLVAIRLVLNKEKNMYRPTWKHNNLCPSSISVRECRRLAHFTLTPVKMSLSEDPTNLCICELVGGLELTHRKHHSLKSFVCTKKRKKICVWISEHSLLLFRKLRTWVELRTRAALQQPAAAWRKQAVGRHTPVVGQWKSAGQCCNLRARCWAERSPPSLSGILSPGYYPVRNDKQLLQPNASEHKTDEF